ncbi:hypothetical protein JHK87_027823 [Glycine soja]|nr:hypothetical protein JHK87_027823 [Glycine soja]
MNERGFRGESVDLLRSGNRPGQSLFVLGFGLGCFDPSPNSDRPDPILELINSRPFSLSVHLSLSIHNPSSEDMKIDHIVEVPDTPDRTTVRHDYQKYLEESYSSQNAPIFRRAQTDGAEKMEKGKSISSKVPSKSSHRALKATNGRSSLPVISDSSNTSRNAFIGKYKLDIKTLPGPNISVDHGKGISLSNDSQLQNEKQVSLPPRVSTSPRGRGHKRLVRNGCISPHNIATMEKQLAEQSNHKTKDVEQSHGHSVSSSNLTMVHTLKCFLVFSESLGEINGPSNAIRNPLQYSGGQGGRRTTHNERNANWHLHDVNGHHLRINNDVGRFINGHNTTGMDRRNTGNGQSSNHIHGSQSDHTAQPTSVIIPDVDQVYVPWFNWGFIKLIPEPLVDLLSTPRYANRSSEDLDDNDNNSSEARARQVEADERLARELQEQLYHDDPFEGRGVVGLEHLAHHLEEEAPGIRQGDPLSLFLLTLAGEGRLDILEALEDSVGDFSDMGITDGIFNARRDFTDADYEMLLALDEGNHQHTGASSNLINSLPQSTIQTDNFTDACAICLETPVQGEIIRHLPCLHKFHKDCIDPWLQRKTSCPVCKSSIT